MSEWQVRRWKSSPPIYGSLEGMRIVESRLVPVGAFVTWSGGEWTLFVHDVLRFRVALYLHNHIERRVTEIYSRLGLERKP